MENGVGSPATISETTRTSFTVGTWVAIIVLVVGWTGGGALYMERRLAASETALKTALERLAAQDAAISKLAESVRYIETNGSPNLTRRVAELEDVQRVNTVKFDRLLEAANQIKIDVARMEERTRKP